MFEVTTYGRSRDVRDRAYAATPADAIAAARTLLADARDAGVAKPCAAFYDADGSLIRYDVTPTTLGSVFS
jgi:hypothetical protein